MGDPHPHSSVPFAAMTGTGPATLATSIRSLPPPTCTRTDCWFHARFGSRHRLAMTYGDAKISLFLALLEQPLRGPRPAEWALGQTQPLLMPCVLYGLHSKPAFGPYFPPILPKAFFRIEE